MEGVIGHKGACLHPMNRLTAVSAKAYSYKLHLQGWHRQRIPIPDNSFVKPDTPCIMCIFSLFYKIQCVLSHTSHVIWKPFGEGTHLLIVTNTLRHILLVRLWRSRRFLALAGGEAAHFECLKFDLNGVDIRMTMSDGKGNKKILDFSPSTETSSPQINNNRFKNISWVQSTANSTAASLGETHGDSGLPLYPSAHLKKKKNLFC